MPTGPKGEKRPRDTNANAVKVMRIATGEDVEEYVAKDTAGQELGRKGGKRRAEKLTPERRSEIARKAAAARWHK